VATNTVALKYWRCLSWHNGTAMKKHLAHITTSSDTTLWLLAALLLAFAPHTLRLPMTISVLCLLFGLWRFTIERRSGATLPHPIIRTFILCITLIIVYLHYGTLLGREAGIALLACMLALKLLEMRTVRDYVIVILLGYFLAITLVLYSQTLPMAAYMILVAFMLTATLIDLNLRQEQRSIQTNLKLTAKLFVQATPIMLILFFLFPRIPGPLWSLPDDAHSGTTGISDEMSMGSISNLSQSDEIAFRVAFDNRVIDNELSYWRGPVLWQTDGKNWSSGKAASINRTLSYRPKGKPINYTVTLEPHNQKWLYGLDLPATVPLQATINRDFQLITKSQVKELKRYKMTSYSEYETGPLTVDEIQRALQLPANRNSRTIALGQQWQQQLQDPETIVNRALRYFNQQPFVYTLKPPLLGNNPVDEFLFNTQQGFCEHYAASFTVLMRAAGIPTRIVTGYQGGDFNPVGNYLIVRQRDAHAWTEVWLADQGWVRIDPTAAVAPERVELGAETAFAELFDRQSTLQFESTFLTNNWLKLRYGWDSLNNSWNQWVIGYDTLKQSQLLSRFGVDSIKQMAIAMVIATVAALTLLLLLSMHRDRKQQDVISSTYQRFCQKFSAIGIQRLPHEGPVDFARRIITLRPDLAPQVHQINDLYIALKYRPRHTQQQIKNLQQQVRQLKL